MRLLGLFILSLFICTETIADTRLNNLSNQDQTEVLNKEWVCEWESASLSGYSGEYILHVNEISSDSIAGSFDNSVCPGETNFAGNIKDDKLRWKVKNQVSPCKPLSVKAKFHREKNGQLVMKGSYQAVCPVGGGFLDDGPV